MRLYRRGIHDDDEVWAEAQELADATLRQWTALDPGELGARLVRSGWAHIEEGLVPGQSANRLFWRSVILTGDQGSQESDEVPKARLIVTVTPATLDGGPTNPKSREPPAAMTDVTVTLPST